MVYGITRELGLSFFKPVKIWPLRAADGSFFATDPYMIFDGPHLFLYSNYAAGTVDMELDLLEPGGNFEHIGQMVDMINKSTFFRASLESEKWRWHRSLCIYNQSNRVIVNRAGLDPSTKMDLDADYLVKDTVFFSNRRTFRTEVATEAEVTSKGKYYVDYQNGIVTSFSPPNTA
jgi:hypothetical protein